MRSAWEAVGEAVLINDAYNANPPSMRAAIDLLDQAGRGGGRQRVAVLGTMGELGTHAARLHQEVARHAMAAELDLVAATGEMAEALRVVAPGDRRVLIGGDIAELWESLRPRLQPNAAILVKGSRSVRLERLVPLITAWAARNS